MENIDLEKAEEAVRQAFDLFQLGASMLNKKEETPAKKNVKSKAPASRATKIITFDSDEEQFTPEEDSEEDAPDADDESLPKPESKAESPISKEDDDYFYKYADDYIDFTAKCPTIYHVVEYFSKLLESRGFKYLSEKEDWANLTPGLYYTTRSGTSLGAFVLGKDWRPEYGAGIVGCHIDALAAKLKPVSKKSDVDGYKMLGVAHYAGALSPVWFDRDLGIAGRVLVKMEDPESDIGFKVVSKLISSSPKPIARISTLAPHFGSAADPPYDRETQAIPVMGFSQEEDPKPSSEEAKSPLVGKHSLELLRYIADLADVKVSDLVQLDLDLFDVQRGTFGGLKDEFIFAPRIDDRINAYTSIQALLKYSSKPIPDKSFSQVLLYDNEEIGSLTRQGAKSTLINSITERVIASLFEDGEALSRVSFANSIILSADVSHLLNPCYKNEYLQDHYPLPNIGMTIALDANGHMATDAVGLALIQEITKANGDKIQYFQIKNGARSGGTIGPSISTETGARTIDLGISQLSMHSIRAATGSKDVGLGISFYFGFFDKWRATYDAFGDL